MIRNKIAFIILLFTCLSSNIVFGFDINQQEKTEINKMLKCDSSMHSGKRLSAKQWVAVFTNECSSYTNYYVLAKNKKDEIKLIDTYPSMEGLVINIDLIKQKGDDTIFAITYGWESDDLRYSDELRIYELDSKKILGIIPTYVRPIIKDFDEDDEDEIIVYQDVFSVEGGISISNWPVVIGIGYRKVDSPQAKDYYFLSFGDLVNYPNVIKMHLKDVQSEIDNCSDCGEEKRLNIQKELMQDKLNRALRIEELIKQQNEREKASTVKRG